MNPYFPALSHRNEKQTESQPQQLNGTMKNEKDEVSGNQVYGAK